MKSDQASATALLVARSLLLAAATPQLAGLMPERGAEFTRRLLAAAGPKATWFDFALRHRAARAALFAVERALLPGIILHYLLRKRQLDRFASDAIASGCRQLVVLGAGLDTLAWRWQAAVPSLVAIEIDHPATQAAKRRVFAAEPGGTTPILLMADLRSATLTEVMGQASRFDPRAPTLFVAEGLLMYLPPSEVDGIIRQLAALAAPGSGLAFSFMEAQPDRPLAFRGGSRFIGWWLRWWREPFLWGLSPDQMEAYLADRGWKLADLGTPDGLRRRHLGASGQDRARLAAGESIARAWRTP